jgi:hypothetical protein
MNSTKSQCPDVLMSGNCTKGQDCPVCADMNVNLNVHAKNYVPKSKRTDISITDSTKNESVCKDSKEQLQLNLNAEEYLPKFGQNLNNQMENLNVEGENEDEDEDDIDEEIENEEFDMIMKDIINNEAFEENEDEESDDEKWFPKYRDCDCCKGFVYKCSGSACVNLGACYCKMKEECDDEDDDM